MRVRATWFDVVREGNAWLVRSQSVDLGRFESQMEALGTAVAEARKLKLKGRKTQVRVLRKPDNENRVYLSVP